MYIDKLDGIINIYNNTYHSKIKMKSVNVKSNTYIDFNIEKKKSPQFEVGDQVIISKYKKKLQRVTPRIRLEKFLWLEILCRGRM